MPKFLRITLIVVLLFLAILAGAGIWLTKTSSGQAFVSQKVIDYLQNKLKTEVKADVRYEIPNWVVLENVFIADQAKDTLLAGKRLYAKLNMKTLLDNKAHVDALELNDISIHLKQNGKQFNYDFIVATFSSPNEKVKADSRPFELSLDKISLQNINLHYQETSLHNSAKIFLKTFETRFDKFDLNRSIYHLQNIDIEGLRANVDFQKFAQEITQTQTKSEDSLNIKLQNLSLKNTEWIANIEPSMIFSQGKIENLETTVDKIYISKPQLALKDFRLQSSIIEYDNKASKKIATGFDANHLKIANLNLSSSQVAYSPKASNIVVEQLKFEEQSGLRVLDFKTQLMVSEKEIKAKKLFIQTPKSLIDNQLELKFNSLSNLSENYEKAFFDAKLSKNTIAFADIVLLIPDLKKNEIIAKNAQKTLYLDGGIKGKLGDFHISSLHAKMGSDTKIDLSGTIKHLPNINQMYVDLQINNFTTSKQELSQFLPAHTLPDSLDLPSNYQIHGNAVGTLQNIQSDFMLKTELGNINFDGNLQDILAKTNQQYEGQVSLENFNLGKVLRQKDIGIFDVSTQFKGKNFDVNKLDVSFNGIMQRGDIKGYTYHDIALSGNLKNKILNLDGLLQDPNANLKIEGMVDLTQQYPKLNIKTNINNLDLQKLNLYAEAISLKGNVDLQLTDTDPTHPAGFINISKSSIYQNNLLIPVGDIQTKISNLGLNKNIHVTSPFFDIEANGKFNYTNLADIFLTETNKYFILPNLVYKPAPNDYHFEIKGTINNHPAIQAFVPALTQIDSLQFNAHFDGERDTTLLVAVQLPKLEYDSMEVKNATFNLFAADSVAHYESSLQEIVSDGFRLRKANLSGEIANNIASFNFVVKDSIDRAIHGIAGKLQSIGKDIKIGFQKSQALLYYTPWQADSTGYLMITPDGILASEIYFHSGKQSLFVNSSFAKPNAPLEVITENIDLNQLSKAFLQDSLLLNGFLSSNILLSDYSTNPTFVGDLQATDLHYTQIPIGNLFLNASNQTANIIKAKGYLLSEKNDVSLEGNYLLNSNKPLDLSINIKKLGAETIEAFSGGMLSHAQGNFQGNLKIGGATDKLKINGLIRADTVNFVIPQLGAKYSLKKQALTFEDQQIRFRDFIITDSLNQKMFVNGNINIGNLPNFSYNLRINANKFLALDAPQQDNSLYFGKAYINAGFNVKGINDKYSVDGDVKIDEKSEITLVLPSDVNETQNDVVEFIDLDKPKVAEKAISSNVSSISDEAKNLKSEVIVNLEADEKSELKIIIDPLNGDFLSARGIAHLTTGINTDDALFMQGRYDITEGLYEMNYQVIKRPFYIDKESKSNIIFTGDPMTAEVNITASYTVNTSIYDFVVAQETQKLPESEKNDPEILKDKFKEYEPLKNKRDIKVDLMMSGQLLKPKLDFKIHLLNKKDNSLGADEVYGSFKLSDFENSLNENPQLREKQVFSLIMLKRFLPEQIESTGISEIFNAESFARTSVSKIISNQLNNLAADVIKGVKLDFNLMSDYVTETSTRNTNLNVGLSKAFLNNRISVSVGRNFELENTETRSSEIFDNLNVNYNLTPDGRYRFKAYRKNQYQAILEGFVVETGVGFTINIDYDKAKELFKK